VAPREVQNRPEVRTLLEKNLDVSPVAAARLISTNRRWSVVPGRYPPSVRETLSDVPGVYLQRELERYHPHGDLARGVLGTIRDDSAEGGIEQWFDGLLRGRPGREAIARDNLGNPLPGETYLVQPPVPGGQVVLTLDSDLQEIARQALQAAIDRTDARGGDVLITDPMTGEILAMVSIRDGKTGGLSSINTAYEPGSTLKPFTVAGILTHGVASLSDTVDVGNGTWDVAGRVLHDVSEKGRMTLADALRLSSNVGIAKTALGFADSGNGERGLTPAQQYENLRDFGFGTPTGVPLPGETGGILRRPDEWSAQSPVSLAIGYEIAVTPLQMAMAYGALANGGLLMEPRLVKEIRDPEGRVIQRFPPRVVRRAVSQSVARSVGRVMVSVVEDGTGTAARLANFRVAGKTGTSRAYSPDGGYEKGDYFASFAGFFPADAPQLVVFVKLEDPKGSYYGGAAAAPVTRATMEAALAARRSPLDRAALLRAERGPAVDVAVPQVRFAEQPIDPPEPPASDELETGAEAGGAEGVSLPDVSGLPLRVAVRRLHALGMRVADPGLGEIVGTVPSAGSTVMPGDTVRLRLRPRTDG
jgi:cell division protein FtsI (penicillin-binding protein 3)